METKELVETLLKNLPSDEVARADGFDDREHYKRVFLAYIDMVSVMIPNDVKTFNARLILTIVGALTGLLSRSVLGSDPDKMGEERRVLLQQVLKVVAESMGAVFMTTEELRKADEEKKKSITIDEKKGGGHETLH